MLDVFSKDYLRTARAKGLAERTVVWKHALRNALIPVITVTGVQLGILLGGTVITEMVFSRQGIGKLLVDGILARDYPRVQGIVAVFAFMVVAVNLLTDLIYTFVDPRVE
jgi:peptide/nickel transport system permease protein